MRVLPRSTGRFGIALAVFSLVLAACSATVLGVRRFEDVTEQVGAAIGTDPVAWGDYDNDGWVDLCTWGHVWHNEKGARFKKLPKARVASYSIWADYDNDGYLDVFGPGGGGKLYRNVKGETFEVSKGLPDIGIPVSLGACWGDFNGDGYIDLYVGGYEKWTVANYPDVILLNGKGASFTEVWRTPEGRYQPARGITAADFDEDGDLDVYVSNYRLQPNLLWQNDGRGSFTDVAGPYGVAGDGGLGAWGHTIGSAWGDFDNDGHLDLFVGNFSHPPAYQDRPKFYKNLGKEGGFHFKDMSSSAGLRWQESYASPALGDFDNDGFLDLYFTTVYPGDHSVLYHNNGDWTFTDVTAEAGVVTERTYQAAWADFDNDGDLDLLSGGKLFRNPGGANHWLKVHLQGNGTSVNRAAIGAQVRIRLGEQVLTRQVEGGTGQGNQNDLTLHFGLGDHGGPVRLEVRWPDGTTQELSSPVDRLIVVRQGAARSNSAPAP